MVAQALARQHPERITGLFFFNCPYPGIGRRWAEAGHLIEIWYQSFHQMPWAAALVGSSRKTCRTYIGHFLRHWAHDPQAFDADLEAWVDNFMKPGNLQGGFDWYLSVAAARAAVIREEAPAMAKIDLPTRIMWGRHDPVLKVEWVDRLPDYFAAPKITIAENAGHAGSVVVRQVMESKEGVGFNALSGEYVDMVKAGILTPTKVERTALQNAAEVAILLTTTDCIVVEAPKKKAAAGHGHDHDHDHGGMDDMDY